MNRAEAVAHVRSELIGADLRHSQSAWAMIRKDALRALIEQRPLGVVESESKRERANTVRQVSEDAAPDSGRDPARTTSAGLPTCPKSGLPPDECPDCIAVREDDEDGGPF